MNDMMQHCSAVSSSFWHSWQGILSLVMLVIVSLYNIFSRRIDDGVVNRTYYWSVAISGSAGLLHIFYHSDPDAVIRVLIIIQAIYFSVTVMKQRWKNFLH